MTTLSRAIFPMPRRSSGLPIAITMRPQFGSPPWMAVFTSGELTIFLAMIFASAADESSRTVHSMSFVAPSDCATMSRASLIDIARTASTKSDRRASSSGTARVEKIGHRVARARVRVDGQGC